jgi:prepilin-type N-terminal cleavage/methylation domain-containing protein
MLKKIRKSNEGFTIIEVMIVLAIAALILLIVLLAVPALQRNSRNTSIKSDAASLTGAISTFESDSDGGTVSAISSNGLVSGTGGATTQAKLQGGTVVDAALSAAPTAVVPHGHLQFWLGHQCGGTASTRAVAVFYSIETSSAESVANNNKCVDA